ncbi:MAG: ribosomal-protein-alanine N-acetyltransferase [Candidatus Aminicenantes bacterium RBG_16_63_16]|nr:MAG: ribosomal-protein-alanine N-acetyltransferase [Candidatus Aminicenantes bacterium RBG_16_63_16]
MEAADLPSVMEIEVVSFPNPWQESTFRGEIQHRPISFPLVVEHSAHNRVIGYIVFWVIGEEAQINNIAVHPDFRRLGVGERVLRQVIAQLRSSGVSMVTLEVRPSNTGAQTLYRKLGFRMIGLRKGYYTNPPEDAFVLALHL